MKKYSLILLLFLLSCKKEQPNSTGSSYQNSCVQTVGFKPYLVGKWKLVQWTATHLSIGTCQWYASNTYIASDWGINAMLEFKSNGIGRLYKNDTLNHETYVTSYTELLENNGERYDLECGNLNLFFYFRRVNVNSDSLSTVQVGDTIIINNPFVDINFTNGSTFSVTWEQRYVKIE